MRYVIVATTALLVGGFGGYWVSRPPTFDPLAHQIESHQGHYHSAKMAMLILRKLDAGSEQERQDLHRRAHGILQIYVRDAEALIDEVGQNMFEQHCCSHELLDDAKIYLKNNPPPPAASSSVDDED